MKAILTFFTVFIGAIIVLNLFVSSSNTNQLTLKLLVAALLAGIAMWMVSVKRSENEDDF